MPVSKEDAHRALQLLEDYYQRLEGVQEKRSLREAVGKVILVFKSKLFNALIDIQDFYELTLLDENKSPHDKTVATMKLAEQWTDKPTSNGSVYERGGFPPPPKLLPRTKGNTGGGSAPRPPVKVMTGPPPSSYGGGGSHRPPPPTFSKGDEGVRGGYSSTSGAAAGRETDVDDVGPDEGIDYEFDEIHLEKGNAGLGFTIAGGSDSPHIPDDSRIYITEVLPSGAAYKDGRLMMNDILVSVNGMNVEDVPHNESVQALHKAGNSVDLVVKRPKPVFNEDIVEINLVKNAKGLGFSIAGGKNNQHIPGDDGIFITKIIDGGSAEEEGTLTVGDRLLSVNDANLECITHEMAVEALKATKTNVRLLVVKSTFPTIPAPPENELAPPPPPQRHDDESDEDNTDRRYVGAGDSGARAEERRATPSPDLPAYPATDGRVGGSTPSPPPAASPPPPVEVGAGDAKVAPHDNELTR